VVLQPPSSGHPFGTDELGRDVWSRVLYAGRPTLILAGSIVALAACIGVAVGVTSGYLGGPLDRVVTRANNILFALPPIALALGIIGALGPGVANLVLALTIVYVPLMARTSRASTLAVRSELYVSAAECVGERTWRILVQQILRNIAGPVAVQVVLVFSYAVLYEASMSYLGLGTQPSNPSWGRLLTDAIPLASVAPWMGIFPGLFLSVTVVGLNLLSDALSDSLDPRKAK